MGISEISVNNSEKLKPLLKKIIPDFLIQNIKRRMLERLNRYINALNIQPYCYDEFPDGINLVGPLDSATGLGQSFRLTERVVRQLDCPYLIYNYEQGGSNKIQVEEYKNRIQKELKYSINLWHINPSEFAKAFTRFGREAFDKRYNIAFWLWELEDFPDEWVSYINLLDEIWTPSEFISKAIRKKTDKPVYTIPYSIEVKTECGRYDRKYFALPEDCFLFLMMYDSQSVKERKNPEGAIQAFQKSFFSQQDDVGLIVKVNSADHKELKQIEKLKGEYRNIFVLNKSMKKIEVDSLIACADVCISLHRAEGFGLVLAEAMWNQIPVIATNWSANTEFMNPDVACMVSYRKIMLKKGIPPYKKGSQWAEPNIEEAADYMKRLKIDKEFYYEIASKGGQYIQDKLGMENIKSLMLDRLQEIRNGR